MCKNVYINYDFVFFRKFRGWDRPSAPKLKYVFFCTKFGAFNWKWKKGNFSKKGAWIGAGLNFWRKNSKNNLKIFIYILTRDFDFSKIRLSPEGRYFYFVFLTVNFGQNGPSAKNTVFWPQSDPFCVICVFWPSSFSWAFFRGVQLIDVFDTFCCFWVS